MPTDQQAEAPPKPEPQAESTDPGWIKAVRLLAFFVLPAGFVAIVAYGLFKTAPPTDLVNRPAPDFSLPLLGGGRLSSGSLKGSPVVINFWASWCIPCREEAPVLEEKWNAYKAQGVKIIGVNVQDSAEDAAAFAKEFHWTFPTVRDTDGVLYRKFGVRGMPETFFVGRDYKFAGVGSGAQLGRRGGTKILGPVKPAVLDGQIKQMLEEKAPNAP